MSDLKPFESLSLILSSIAIIATVAGAIAAVLISQHVEHRRRERQGRMELFRTLLTMRRFFEMPAWTVAFNAVPVEFNGYKEVLSVWRALLTNCNHQPTAENEVNHFSERRRLTTLMLFRMAQSLRIELSEGEINFEEYYAKGLEDREQLYQASLHATCAIADATQRSANAAEAMVGTMQSGIRGV